MSKYSPPLASDEEMAEMFRNRPQPQAPGPAAQPSTSIADTLSQVVDADDFMQIFFPDIAAIAYRWQREELIRLSGYKDPRAADYESTRFEPNTDAPLLMSLCAANGSGKDQIVLTIWALYCICCKQNFMWIGTSSSYNQLHEQTWRHIQTRAEQLNKVMGSGFLLIRKHKVKCTHTNSEILLFRSDEGLKTEGFHPVVENGPMAIVLNECKSLEPEVIMSFKKCHGYTHWLNISSPGDPFGYFYDKCSNARSVNYPNPLIPGREYFRRVDYTLCPHLHAEYRRDVIDFGEDDPYILSSYKALFVAISKLFIIPPDRISYEYPERAGLGLPRRAGLDLSLGGDATVLSVWEGNYFVGEWTIREPHEPSLTEMLVEKIKEMDLNATQVYADAGGLGMSIIQRIREAGLNINAVVNQGTPRNKKVFKNRGSELAFNVRRLVLDKILNLEGTSEKLRRQMGARYYEVKDGRKVLEPKDEFRARCGYSPDSFDAMILAHAGISHHAFRAAVRADEKKEDEHALPRNWKLEYESIYGKVDTDRANAGAWRTSGVYYRRKIGHPLRNLN